MRNGSTYSEDAQKVLGCPTLLTLGSLYVVLNIPLAEVGGGLLGGACNEPSTVDEPACRVIFPEWVDAWQVIPVIAVALVAVSRGSYRIAHGAMVTGLVMTLREKR